MYLRKPLLQICLSDPYCLLYDGTTELDWDCFFWL